MTAWASSIVHDPTTYPMGATATEVFSGVTALARVEWHNNRAGVPIATPIRGVTIYEVGAAPPGPGCTNAMSLVTQSCPIPGSDDQGGSSASKFLALGFGGAAAYVLTRWLQARVAHA